MALATSPRSIKLKGNAVFNKLSGSYYQGGIKIPNVTLFGYQPQATSETIRGTELENYGTTLDSYSETDDLLININFNRFSGAALAELASLGTETEISTGTTAITGENVRLYGGSGELGHMSITAASVVVRGLDITVDDTTGFAAGDTVTNDTSMDTVGICAAVADGTSLHVFLWDDTPSENDTVGNGTVTALVSSAGSIAKDDLAALTTDFTEDTTNGQIDVVTGGALDVSALTRIKINYSHSNIAGSLVSVGTDTLVKGRLTVKGTNLIDDKIIEIVCPQVNISPNSLISLMGDERPEAQITGVAELITGETAAIYVRMAE